MLPITEFQFAFCGIATVAATLGYAYTRKATHSPTSTDQPGADVEAGPLEERSLKRKLDDSDTDEACIDQQQRPMKRSKTPPTEQRGEDEDEWEVIVAPPTYEEATAPRKKGTPEHIPSPRHNVNPTPDIKASNEESPDRATSDETCADKQDVRSEKPSEPVSHTPNPSLPLSGAKAEPEVPVTPPPKPAKVQAPTSNPFSAFAHSSSTFATYANPNSTSLGLANQGEKTTPAWRRKKEDPEITSDDSTQKLTRSPNDISEATGGLSSTVLQSTQKAPAKQPSSYITGEEGEVVTSDLKGAKLFIKRGRKEFTSGMYGHVKLLSYELDASASKGDKEGDEGIENAAKIRTRLLFRRDPLGQVSMNVALRPTVRCHFDEAENILRVILKEQITVDKEAKEDIVIYALKPGRASKADFRAFAKAVCDSERLKDTH
ncbi:hypothetical protein EDC04DRAFT_296282 [Pisolithus marmoratus]|nr:hypothetical protein EDC04DRAFT_296282 [Pisolithus marmoratus]